MASEMTERNRRILERFIAEGVLEGRLDVFDELCDRGVVNHAAAPQAREGIDALKRVIGFSRAAMPDQRWTDRVVVADGEYVVVRAVRESTWSAGSFRGDLRRPRRRLEKLRAWFAPADGEDALWLWLPRCFW
jgi:predicted ester cyclase